MKRLENCKYTVYCTYLQMWNITQNPKKIMESYWYMWWEDTGSISTDALSLIHHHTSEWITFSTSGVKKTTLCCKRVFCLISYFQLLSFPLHHECFSVNLQPNKKKVWKGEKKRRSRNTLDTSGTDKHTLWLHTVTNKNIKVSVTCVDYEVPLSFLQCQQEKMEHCIYNIQCLKSYSEGDGETDNFTLQL